MLKTIAYAALLAASLGGTAFAEDRAPDIAVSYGDLDLTKTADIRVLDRRIARAIPSTCADTHGTHDLARQREAAQCRVEKRKTVAEQRGAALARAAQTENALAMSR